MTILRAGQEVICVIGGRFCPRGLVDPPCGWPVTGQKYTVTSTGINHFGNAGVQLAELRHPIDNGWVASRFRPVKTTSIECFKVLLAPVTTKQKEPV